MVYKFISFAFVFFLIFTYTLINWIWPVVKIYQPICMWKYKFQKCKVMNTFLCKLLLLKNYSQISNIQIETYNIKRHGLLHRIWKSALLLFSRYSYWIVKLCFLNLHINLTTELKLWVLTSSKKIIYKLFISVKLFPKTNIYAK